MTERLIAAAHIALAALERTAHATEQDRLAAAGALRDALAAQPAAEPVAWMWRTSAAFPKDVAFTTDRDLADSARENGMQVMPLCAAQPARAGGDAPMVVEKWPVFAGRMGPTFHERKAARVAALAAAPQHATVTINGEAPTARTLLAAMVDIHDDEQKNAPEHRCYTPEAWSEALTAARAFLAAPQPAAAEPATPDHTLKTDPEVFQAVFDGRKTFEIRLNDRGFKVGDWLRLRETTHTGAEIRAGAPLAYTGRELMRCVTHVLTGYGLTDGWCCLSLAATSVEQPAAAEHVVDANKMVRPDHLVDLNKMFPPDFNALIGWLADEAHAAIRAAYPAVRTESLDRAVQSYFEAMQPAASTVPAGYVSAEQLAAHQDPEGDEPFGRYLPVRKTPAGKFTQPIYTAAPAVVGTVPAGWTDDQMVRFAPYARTGVLSGLTDEARLGVFRQDEEKRGIAAPAAVEREALTDEALKRRGDDCLLLESGWTRTVGVRTAFEIGFRDAERAHGIGSSKEGGDAA